MEDGLLGFLGSPAGQGLLAAAAGTMAGARRGQPWNTAGRGAMAGLAGYGSALDQGKEAQALALQKMQMDRLTKQYGKEDQVDALGRQFFTPGTPGLIGTPGAPEIPGTPGDAGPMPSTPAIPSTPSTPATQPRFDMQGYSSALMGADPQKGIALMQALQKDTPFGKVDAKDFTPESIAKFAATRDFSVLAPVRKMEVSPNGQAFNPYDVKPGTFFPDPNKPFSVGANGEFVPNTPYQKYEFGKAHAGASTAITNVNAFEPFANKVQGEMGSALVKNFETLQNVPQTLQALDAAKKNLAESKNFIGSGAETKLAVAKFFNNNLGTNIDPTGVKNTEALQSALFYNVMDNLKKMDASPSQQQQIVMQDAFGRITTDPAALPMIIDFYKNQVVSKATEHNRRVDEAANGPSKLAFPYDIRVNLPKQQDAPPGKTVVKTGMYGGKKVIQYSDGSTEYAN